MKSSLVILLALVAVGCASTERLVNINNPNATESDRTNDYDQCNYEAMKSTPNSGTFAGTAREISLINTCMKLKGWRVVR